MSCRVKKKMPKAEKHKNFRVKGVQEVEFLEQQEDAICINMVNVKDIGNVNAWLENLIVEGKTVNFKLDTGAQVNILPKIVLGGIVPNIRLENTVIILEAFCGTKIKPFRQCNFELQV